jgi:phosphatidate cytidylyltransferase
MWKNLGPRILIALAALPIVVASTYFGGWLFFVFVTLLALLSLNEFYSLMNTKGISPSYLVGFLATVFFTWFTTYTLKHPNWEPYATGILTTAIIFTFSAGIFLKRAQNSTVNTSITLLGILYIGWMFSYLILVRELPVPGAHILSLELANHGAYLFFLIIAIWAGDTTAYFIGKKFGKRKLSPYISPKKTIEGAVSGLAVSVASAAIFSMMIGMSMVHGIILGVIIGIVGQVGDLAESLIKRDAGVKDSSNLVPGHGGMLDRMDSFILTAPIMYYYITWFVLR